MFIKELADYSTDRTKMGVITKTKEDYITFSISVEVGKYIDKGGEVLEDQGNRTQIHRQLQIYE